MLKRRTTGKKLHFLIFERDTEEESVRTISDLLSSIGHRVTVFISSRIASLISDELAIIDVNVYVLPENLEESLNKVNEFIELNSVDLCIFTRYSVGGTGEQKLFKKFVKNNQVCSLVENYDRWFSPFPPIKLNGYKVIKRSKIIDWMNCRDIFDDFSCYFVSDIHPSSDNPFKKLIRKRNNKPILDFPFKVKEQDYNPIIEYIKPVFVIPGSVSCERRDYNFILDIFVDNVIKDKDWELILLGRPVGKDGHKIIERIKQINEESMNKKILFFDKYVSKENFDYYMAKSTHIIAPIKPNAYKSGKDTGAIYDILKYNKIGIVNRNYFYSDKLPEIDSMYTYKDKKEFLNIIELILKREFSTLKFNLLNEHFSLEVYKSNIKNSIGKLFQLN